MYNILVKDEDGYSQVFLTTSDLEEAKSKVVLFILNSKSPSLLISEPAYKSIRIEKSELICEVDIPQIQ